MLLFDLERDHVNPAVRAVGKSEVEMKLYIVTFFQGKGLNGIYNEMIATENNEMIMHWERCNGI